MIGIASGFVGFALFFLYDVNSVKWKNRLCRSFFFVGCVCLLFGTGRAAWEAWTRSGGGILWGAALAAAFFFVLLVYTLFFALPFSKTYGDSGEKSDLCSRGVYALCRHPGVLWFLFLYIFLSASLGDGLFWLTGMSYCMWNYLYVLFQDLWTFPKMLTGYSEYKAHTPFLIPTGNSIMRCITTLKR